VLFGAFVCPVAGQDAEPIAGTPGVPDADAVIDLRSAPAEAPLAEAAPRAGEVAPRPVPRPADLPRPLPPGARAPRAPAAVGALPLGPSPSITESFLALPDVNTAIPPDTDGAVGPGHLMVTLNTQVRIQNRDGSLAVADRSLNGFWSAVNGGSGAFDPHTFYDPYANRFVTLACDDPRAASSAILIGTSRTADPTGTWDLHRVDVDATDTLWADFPSVGFNNQWVVVQVNMFTFAAGEFIAALNALALENKVNILSSPSVMTSENKKAVINVSTSVPIVTSQQVPVATGGIQGNSITQTVEYKDAGIILTVTPRIGEKGTVALDVKQEVNDIIRGSSIGNAGNSPSFSKREAETSVVLLNNQTLVLGGLIQSKKTSVRTGIPFLSRIPVLGYLFGSTDEGIEKTELLILITPRVIGTVLDAARLTEKMRTVSPELDQSLKMAPPKLPSTSTPAPAGGSGVRIVESRSALKGCVYLDEIDLKTACPAGDAAASVECVLARASRIGGDAVLVEQNRAMVFSCKNGP